MSKEAPVTAVQEDFRRRRWLRIAVSTVVLLVFLLGIVGTVLGAALLWQFAQNRTPYYADVVEHFKYGSIGAEPESGIPYRVWRALPRLFPEAFDNRSDYAAFGFLYEDAADGGQRDLPIGIALREYRGVEVVWFNCATCHTGTVQTPGADGAAQRRQIIAGMPSNNLDLQRFVRFVLDAGADERLSPNRLIAAINETGPKLGWMEETIYRWYVIPLLREGLVLRRSRLQPLLARQAPWGPGRVDTFNPYKLIQANIPLSAFADNELAGMADFPAIFQQGPRDKMHLHWDGNNTSLQERNLSAAMGAGVTATSADHPAIERVADWLLTLRPPQSPHRPDPAAVARGRVTFMRDCAGCHGYQDGQSYVFSGARLGEVEPISGVNTDRGRLNSYTERFRQVQLAEFFKGTDYQFKTFKKTDGYANQPLDGLWLRSPYLHNGSVPTLADLLEPAQKRPTSFIRGSDRLDGARGGFVAGPCDPPAVSANSFCFDTSRPGNGNGGHLYGTELPPAEKSDLLSYLLTF